LARELCDGVQLSRVRGASQRVIGRRTSKEHGDSGCELMVRQHAQTIWIRRPIHKLVEHAGALEHGL